MSVSRPARFVDTNILVYAHDTTAGAKHQMAKALLEDLWRTRDGCLSTQILQEFYVAITRKVAQPLARDVALQHLTDLATWRIHVPQVDDLLRAVGLQGRHNVSFWDAMILRSAAQMHCTLLLTEDLNHGQNYGEVRALNPFLAEQSQVSFD